MVPVTTGTKRLSFILSGNNSRIAVETAIEMHFTKEIPVGKKNQNAMQVTAQARLPSRDFFPIRIFPKFIPISAAAASPKIIKESAIKATFFSKKIKQMLPEMKRNVVPVKRTDSSARRNDPNIPVNNLFIKGILVLNISNARSPIVIENINTMASFRGK